MPVLRREQPSAAKAEFITAVMYGLKAVPFREASFSAACEAVPFVEPERSFGTCGLRNCSGNRAI
jgi:hypothetical protein